MMTEKIEVTITCNSKQKTFNSSNYKWSGEFLSAIQLELDSLLKNDIKKEIKEDEHLPYYQKRHYGAI